MVSALSLVGVSSAFPWSAKAAQLETAYKTGDVTTLLNGANIVDDENSHRAGARGPLLMQDINFRIKMHHFDHEPIPERVVHARGSGAHGHFELLESLGAFSKAALFNEVGEKTPVFVRFSTVVGNKGSADAVRDVRGFATKFYTKEGNWDLVGNNIPVFFIQDGIKFPDMVHAAKPENHNEMPQASSAHDNFWDFMSLELESSHMITWLMSDRAIPRSYRMMQGFGVHTFALLNAAGNRTFVKFHWRPKLGVHSLVWDEAVKINGVDPDYHRRDLYDAISLGAYPEWDFGVQLIPEADEDKFDFDILDATKLIPEELVPIRWVGKMQLNRNPVDFFAETEQVAYGVHNLVPGIDFTNDPLLQARTFSYFDTNIRRHGTVNFDQLPINRPLCPVMNNLRGGNMQTAIHPGPVNYSPNRYGVPHPTSTAQSVEHYAQTLQGMVTRMRGPKFADHFSQATLFYNSLSPLEQAHVTFALQFELSKVTDENIRNRTVYNMLNNIDHTLAVNVATALSLTPPPLTKSYPSASSAKLSQFAYAFNTTIMSRKVAILVADGYDSNQLTSITGVLTALGATPFIVGPRAGQLKFTNANGQLENGVKTNFTLFNSKSVLFDSVLLVSSASRLVNMSESIVFVKESFKHHKVIGAIGDGVDILKAAMLPVRVAMSTSIMQDQGVVSVTRIADNDYGSLTAALPALTPDAEHPPSITNAPPTLPTAPASSSSPASPDVSISSTSQPQPELKPADDPIHNFIMNGIDAVFPDNDTAKFMQTYVRLLASHRYWTRDTSKVAA